MRLQLTGQGWLGHYLTPSWALEAILSMDWFLYESFDNFVWFEVQSTSQFTFVVTCIYFIFKLL